MVEVKPAGPIISELWSVLAGLVVGHEDLLANFLVVQSVPHREMWDSYSFYTLKRCYFPLLEHSLITKQIQFFKKIKFQERCYKNRS